MTMWEHTHTQAHLHIHMHCVQQVSFRPEVVWILNTSVDTVNANPPMVLSVMTLPNVF